MNVPGTRDLVGGLSTVRALGLVVAVVGAFLVVSERDLRPVTAGAPPGIIFNFNLRGSELDCFLAVVDKESASGRSLERQLQYSAVWEVSSERLDNGNRYTFYLAAKKLHTRRLLAMTIDAVLTESGLEVSPATYRLTSRDDLERLTVIDSKEGLEIYRQAITDTGVRVALMEFTTVWSINSMSISPSPHSPDNQQLAFLAVSHEGEVMASFSCEVQLDPSNPLRYIYILE